MNYFANHFNLRRKLKFKTRKALPLELMAIFVATSVFTAYSSSRAKAAIEDSPKTIIDEVWQIVNSEFVDRGFNHVDWRLQRRELLSKDYANTAEAYRAIRQSLESLGDPYTRFLDPKEFEQLTSQTSGELTGVGIRLAIDETTSQLIVVEPLANSPAARAGIESGDRIVRIDNRSTELMSIEQASEAIKGEVGTEVSLQIARKGEPAFDVILERAQIELPSVDYRLESENGQKVGYIKLDEFSSHAAEQMQQAIEELSNKQASGFVLDLRGNPGGLLFSSVEIARMWMEKGQIVSTIDRKGGIKNFQPMAKH